MRVTGCALHAGKLGWESRQRAEVAKRDMRQAGRARASDLCVYQCNRCGLWLLGSKQARKQWRRAWREKWKTPKPDADASQP